uniref:Polysaccharide biosynthesis domain-containing protein n=1 Tax=Denticeps clupeoides TaxID=299321 RepID=A0AAY4EDN0_9TELE
MCATIPNLYNYLNKMLFFFQPQLEVMWAMKAYNHAEVYFNVCMYYNEEADKYNCIVLLCFALLNCLLLQLISSVDPKFLKLTKSDDNIYSAFIETFSDLDLQMLDPDKLKSSDAKEKWRPFCNQFEGIVEDFNYGTLLRLDSRKDYTEENTIFATRIQFFAIEIARNRQGHNDSIFQAGCKAKQSKGKGQS